MCTCILFHTSMRAQGVYINRVDNVDDQFEAVENDLQVRTLTTLQGRNNNWAGWCCLD